VSADAPTRVALFGGSFDPPHVGHVLAASWVLATTDVHALWLLPTYDHPFDKDLTAFEHRRRMCELAFAPLRGVTVNDVESRMKGESYTVLTLERLSSEHPGVAWKLMIGTDLVEQIPRWHQGHRIEELAELLVVGRGGHEPSESEIAMPAVSSTDVRQRLRAGLGVASRVPRSVLAYIEEHGLYRG